MNKYEMLKEYLKSLGSVAIAFSSGVDSTFLLKTAHEVLKENVIAVTASSDIFPESETVETEEFCKREGIRHIVFRYEPFELDGFAANPENRCYLCKKALFTKIKELAAENGFKHVAEGSNADDTGDYRPGMAAVKELSIKSPLLEAGLKKAEIRELSKALGLKTYAKPSLACLASRFVYGEEITKEKLKMVESGEKILFENEFSQARVRIHANLARIEVEKSEITKFFQNGLFEIINNRFRSLGFVYVTLDLGGYETGSMNRTIDI